MLRTYQPKKRQRAKEHGFRKRCRRETAARCLPAAVQRAEKSSAHNAAGVTAQRRRMMPAHGAASSAWEHELFLGRKYRPKAVCQGETVEIFNVLEKKPRIQKALRHGQERFFPICRRILQEKQERVKQGWPHGQHQARHGGLPEQNPPQVQGNLPHKRGKILSGIRYRRRPKVEKQACAFSCP